MVRAHHLKKKKEITKLGTETNVLKFVPPAHHLNFLDRCLDGTCLVRNVPFLFNLLQFVFRSLQPLRIVTYICYTLL